MRWIDSEQKALEIGLERFGRDWEKIEAFMGTRTVGGIKSRVKTYFLQLLEEGKDLPKKVCETGNGYAFFGFFFYIICELMIMSFAFFFLKY